MNLTPIVASQIFGVPLLIDQTKLDTILAALGPRIGIKVEPPDQAALEAQRAQILAERAERAQRMASLLVGESVAVTYDEQNDYYLARDVAIFPMLGTLVQRGSWLGSMSGLIGYDEVRRMRMAAESDHRVARIVYEWDCPGGSAAGAFDCADWLYAARDGKPAISVVNEFAASGGYLLAAAVGEIVMTRTAAAGSIGVVMAHVDRSKEMEKAGRAVTFVYAGEKKIDGNPMMPLPARVKKDMQASVEKTYEMFVSAVAKYRGLSVQKIRDTEAGVYDSDEAVKLGLADRIEAFDTELSNQVFYGRDASKRLDAQTSEKTMDPNTPSAAPAVTTAQVEAAKTEGTKLGAEAQKARIKAIMTSDEAKDRAELASHLAYETEMSAEDAVKMLGKAAKETKSPGDGNTPLARAMERNGTPGVSNQAPGNSPAKKVIDADAHMLNRRKAVEAARNGA